MFVVMVMIRPEGLAGAIHLAIKRLRPATNSAPQGAAAE
jgi:hypothetical protein